MSKIIIFGHNFIKVKGAKALAEVLKLNKNLSKLNRSKSLHQ